jgi:hypothetical protein
MPMSSKSSPVRAASVLGFLLVLAGCTPGGQFDPTEMFNSDVFDSKTKLKGDRVPLFPNGVPGTTTGVPADLVKGYQPPPDQADNSDADANTGPAAASPPKAQAPAEAPKPKPKVAAKPKPKVAAAQKQDSVWNQAPAGSAPTRISVGPNSNPAAVQNQSQTAWPAPPSPQQATRQSQSVWPTPPSTAPAQQTAQPSQSVWPNPPATGTPSQ